MAGLADRVCLRCRGRALLRGISRLLIDHDGRRRERAFLCCPPCTDCYCGNPDKQQDDNLEPPHRHLPLLQKLTGRLLIPRIGYAEPAQGLRKGEGMAPDHIARGADEALIVDDAPALDFLQQAAAGRVPDAILIGATVRGTELAARLSQRLKVGCASDCLDLSSRDGRIIVERRVLGRFVCREEIETRPAVATVPARRHAIPPAQSGRRGRTERLRIGPPGTLPATPDTRMRLIGTRLRPGSSAPVDEADVVVAVGRGLRRKEDLAMVEGLALALGGAVGASRPLTDDLRWLPSDLKIGLSGETVSPKLYIACGISGQIEHVVGMRDSAVVVAINSDRNAPIMDQADYRLIGDIYEIIPALTREVLRLSLSGGGGAPSPQQGSSGAGGPGSLRPP